MSENYNGWTNYATWHINLEIFDGLNILDFYPNTDPDMNELASFLEKYALDLISEGGNELAIYYATDFLHNVNWAEIAEQIIGNKEKK